MQKSGEKILDLYSRNQVHEAQQITAIIQNGVASGDIKYSDIAILFRNSFLTRNVENAFVHANIPYKMVSGVSFYDRKEVKDILCFLDFLVNPENLTSLERIINCPKRGIGTKSIEKLSQVASQKYASYAIITTKDALKVFEEASEELSGKAKKGLKEFIEVLKELSSYWEDNDPTPDKLISELMRLIKYDEYLESYDADGYDQRLLNVTELKNIAATYTDVGEFLADVMTSKSDTEDEEDDNKVNIMTMHASKGLEYRLVIIADAVDGVVPSWRCASAADMQEERRLFYVAMTRAKENLVICHPETMLQKGRPTRVHPSTFISQISSEYLTTVAR
jgi:DNA helicase-2/ATP-dependent DNA helicase PcrA